jgi:hypothetical protein
MVCTSIFRSLDLVSRITINPVADDSMEKLTAWGAVSNATDKERYRSYIGTQIACRSTLVHFAPFSRKDSGQVSSPFIFTHSLIRLFTERILLSKQLRMMSEDSSKFWIGTYNSWRRSIVFKIHVKGDKTVRRSLQFQVPINPDPRTGLGFQGYLGQTVGFFYKTRIPEDRQESKELDSKRTPLASRLAFFFGLPLLWWSMGWWKGLYLNPYGSCGYILASASFVAGVILCLCGFGGLL